MINTRAPDGANKCIISKAFILRFSGEFYRFSEIMMVMLTKEVKDMVEE